MKTFYILLLFLFTIIVKAQYSSIKGKITIENQSENLDAKVVIKETNKQVAIDKKGNFEISGITAGTYTLVFSAFGYQDQQKIIYAKENENQIINIFLKENINALQTVEITGRKEKSYKKKLETLLLSFSNST